jgi:tetratricopeptide (TPR) repeat protein
VRPTESGYDSRRHPWITLAESVRLLAPELWWDHGQPLYDAGRHAEAADRGLELIEGRRDQPFLYYNVACCESRAGRTADALEHLRIAIAMWDECRQMARDDPDFAAIRGVAAFEALVDRTLR